MLAGGSTYFLVACVVVGAMTLVGLGVLFARAENIERPWLVGLCTLGGSAISAVLLWNASRMGAKASDGIAWTCIFLSIFGFFLGRLCDRLAGPRDIVRHDDATLGADLAD